MKMRVVDFLVLLLRAQAETLQLMSAALGEERLLELLEEKEPPRSHFRDVTHWTTGKFLESQGESNPYKIIEGAVKEFQLPAILEFYLWATPAYRAWIESPALLDLELHTELPNKLDQIADLCWKDARSYLGNFTIALDEASKIEKLIQPTWLKLRTQLMSLAGTRGLRAL